MHYYQRREREGDKYLSLNNPLRSGYCGADKVAGVRDSKKAWRLRIALARSLSDRPTYSQMDSLYN